MFKGMTKRFRHQGSSCAVKVMNEAPIQVDMVSQLTTQTKKMEETGGFWSTENTIKILLL